jgi:hypothetical protein
MKRISRDEARQRDLTQFFTGKPCVHGHVDLRFTCNQRCAECGRIEGRARHTANPHRASLKNWFAPKVKAWRHAHPELAQAIVRLMIKRAKAAS